MKKRTLVAVLALLAVAAPLAIRRADGQAGASRQGLSNWVVVYLGEGGPSPHAIESPQIRTLGGRQFLVGRGVDTGFSGGWETGTTYWLAMEDITSIQSHASLANLRRSYEPVDSTAVQ